MKFYNTIMPLSSCFCGPAFRPWALFLEYAARAHFHGRRESFAPPWPSGDFDPEAIWRAAREGREIGSYGMALDPGPACPLAGTGCGDGDLPIASGPILYLRDPEKGVIS